MSHPRKKATCPKCMYVGFPAFDGNCAQCAGPLTDGDVTMNDTDQVSDAYAEAECGFCGLILSESEITSSCPRCATSFVFEGEDSEDEDDSDKGKKKGKFPEFLKKKMKSKGKDDEDDDSEDDDDDSEDDDDSKNENYNCSNNEEEEDEEEDDDDSEDDDSEDDDDDKEDDDKEDDSDDDKNGGRKVLLDKNKKMESALRVEPVDPIDEASFYINMAMLLDESVAKDIASHIIWEVNSQNTDAPSWLPQQYVEDWELGVTLGRPKNFLGALSCFRGVIGSR